MTTEYKHSSEIFKCLYYLRLYFLKLFFLEESSIHGWFVKVSDDVSDQSSEFTFTLSLKYFLNSVEMRTWNINKNRWFAVRN